MNGINLEQEKELIALCKTDLSHFNDLYKAFMPDVYRYCYSKLGNKSESEDVTSQTFLSALENIQNYIFKDKSIKCWLFIIARNIIYKGYRKPETIEFDETWQAAEDDNILDVIADKELLSKIEQFIKTCKPPVPEIVRLKIWEEMTFDEIAQILNISLSSAKMSYYRSMGKVNELFGKEVIS
jgi:RNA polymerase sigma-70 factor (ECF subfamily)